MAKREKSGDGNMAKYLVAVCRPEGPIAENEISVMGGLSDEQLVRYRLLDEDAGEPSDINWDDYAGLVITGSPLSFANAQKDDAHLRLERRIGDIARFVLDSDYPTLAICYGLQALTLASGGHLVGGYAEDLQAPRIELTEDGLADPLARKLPDVFYGYTGHSDAVGEVPQSATVLATGDFCPIQMLRWGQNVYGTQFHPEIDRNGMRVRIGIYSDKYYPADQKEVVLERCDSADVSGALALTREFFRRYQ
ncbi:MAG: gamma-glutamyl-gamma-aminobutyrate hydrolase family protein [Actinomycetaceae bacterium]|nr:gamma-glutamyl-gamma-aminobutyrate hydrolase family protein [Actinomycetaceae bacterium]